MRNKLEEVKRQLLEGRSFANIYVDESFSALQLNEMESRSAYANTLPPLTEKIKLHSLFYTLDGECSNRGPLVPSVFVRFGGCGLRCWKSSGYCDSPSSLSMNYPWPEYTVAELIERIAEFPTKNVTITGGDPMQQGYGACLLGQALLNKDYSVNIETAGHIAMTRAQIYSFSCVIADLKPPSTEMSKFMKPEFYSRLRSCDFVKCVVEDTADFEWCIHYLSRAKTKASIAMSPRWGYMESRHIANLVMYETRLPLRLNLQLHKYIWPEAVQAPVVDLKAFDSKELMAEMVNRER
jgi:7-carboxy-7-deazaguanine synthase